MLTTTAAWEAKHGHRHDTTRDSETAILEKLRHDTTRWGYDTELIN